MGAMGIIAPIFPIIPITPIPILYPYRNASIGSKREALNAG